MVKNSEVVSYCRLLLFLLSSCCSSRVTSSGRRCSPPKGPFGSLPLRRRRVLFCRQPLLSPTVPASIPGHGRGRGPMRRGPPRLPPRTVMSGGRTPRDEKVVGARGRIGWRDRGEGAGCRVGGRIRRQGGVRAGPRRDEDKGGRIADLSPCRGEVDRARAACSGEEDEAPQGRYSMEDVMRRRTAARLNSSGQMRRRAEPPWPVASPAAARARRGEAASHGGAVKKETTSRRGCVRRYGGGGPMPRRWRRRLTGRRALETGPRRAKSRRRSRVSHSRDRRCTCCREEVDARQASGCRRTEGRGGSERRALVCRSLAKKI
jgi:hypothetical protein